MTDFNKLACQVMDLDGPSYEMDCAIWDAIYPGERAARFEKLTAKGSPYHMRLGLADMDGYVRPLRAFTASLDAAMTLVPEGWQWYVTSCDEEDIAQACVTSPLDHDKDGGCKDYAVHASAPALALTAAVLFSKSEA